MSSYNHKLEQKIKTDASGITVDRSFIAHFQVSEENAVAANSDGVLSSTALTAEAQQITEGITNPAVPRNIKIVGNAAGITGDVIITGMNYANEEITETIALNGDTVVEGNKSFKTVTQIDLPVETHVGTDTVSVGFGDKLGLPYILAHNTVLYAFLDNVKESTDPTVTVSITDIESNTVDLNSALNGKVVDIYLVV